MKNKKLGQYPSTIATATVERMSTEIQHDSDEVRRISGLYKQALGSAMMYASQNYRFQFALKPR